LHDSGSCSSLKLPRPLVKLSPHLFCGFFASYVSVVMLKK